MLVAMARPQATVRLPRLTGTVMLTFDVSGSMAAEDLKPNRMEAAKTAARSFVERQPTSVQTQTAPTPSSPGAAHDLTSWVHAQRAWVACLRSNGMTVDDPDANGDVNVQLGPGESKAGGRVGAALSACQTLQVPRPAAVGPTFTAQQIEMFRSYARCMQQIGAPDFPDPQADGSPPKRQPGIQLWDGDTPGARQASAACGHIVGDLGIAGAGLG